MPGGKTNHHKPRELRRSVLLPARLRSADGWSDACVLNVSSRGLQVHVRVPLCRGSTIELRHQETVIVAQVVWHTGSRAGLRTSEALPVENLLVLGQTSTCGDQSRGERRRRLRTHEQERTRGHYWEFAGMALFAAALAGGAFTMVQDAFARPMGEIGTMLAR